jgi:hypothetical protein
MADKASSVPTLHVVMSAADDLPERVFISLDAAQLYAGGGGRYIVSVPLAPDPVSIYLVVDADETVVKAFTERAAADAFVADANSVTGAGAWDEHYAVAVPLDAA